MRELLPYLFILICPLAMFLMMRGMHGRGARTDSQHPQPAQRGILGAREAEDVAALREQRDRLEARVQELEARMSRVS